MSLIVIAADKGSPGVTTASVALAAIWPRPVLLAECDPSGGDLVYRLPAADGGPLDPRRGLLNVAVAARRGLEPHQVWEHSQKLHGGLDVLAGVSGAEQGVGLELLWGAVGKVLAGVPQADVIADCGRLGADGPIYDLLAEAASVVLLSRATVGEVIRLRDRAAALAAALGKRGGPATRVSVVVVADYKNIGAAVEQVGHALRQSGAPGNVIGGLAYEPKSAEQLRGEWGGKLDKSMFIRTARAIAADLVAGLPDLASPNGQPARGLAPQTPVQGWGQPQPYYSPHPGPMPGQPNYQGPGAIPDPHLAPSGPRYAPGPAAPHYPAGPGTGPQHAVAPGAQYPGGGPGTGPQHAVGPMAHPPAGPGTVPQHLAAPDTGPQYAPAQTTPDTGPQYAPASALGSQHPSASWARPGQAQAWPPPAVPPGAGQGGTTATGPTVAGPTGTGPATAGPTVAGPTGTGPATAGLHLLPHRPGRGRHAGRRGDPPQQQTPQQQTPQQQQPEPTSGPSGGHPGGR